MYINYIHCILCADHKVANNNVKSSFQISQTNNKRRHWYHSAECCVLWFPHCGFYRTKQHINIILELLQPQTWFKRLNMRAPCSMLLSWKSNIYRCQNQNGPFPPKDVTETWGYHLTVDSVNLTPITCMREMNVWKWYKFGRRWILMQIVSTATPACSPRGIT